MSHSLNCTSALLCGDCYFCPDKTQYFATFKGSNELAIKVRTDKTSVNSVMLDTQKYASFQRSPAASSFDAFDFHNRCEILFRNYSA